MKKLTRDPRRGVIAGVAAGFGAYLDVDPVLVRLAFVLLALLNGLGLVLYLACWVLMARSDAAETAPGNGAAGPAPGAATVLEEVRAAGARLSRGLDAQKPEAGRLVIGSALVILGLALLLDNLGWLQWPSWARIEVLWPVIFIALGARLLVRPGAGRERA